MWAFGGWKVNRVADPGFELVLPQDQPTVEALRRSPWLHPYFVTDDWSLRIGSAALVVRGGHLVAVVDPWLAFDDPTRFEPRLKALEEIGVRPQDVDVVINSHVDGLGANVVPESDQPAFPKARYLVPAAEIDAVRAGQRPGAEPLAALAAVGAVEPVTAPVELADGLTVVDLPGHTAGHVGVRIGSTEAGAIIVGHLFLHPAQIANTGSVLGDFDPTRLRRTREELLRECADQGTLLIGPLFGAPGAGHVVLTPDGWALET
jgi:glyoxylase-like metal-dependent hydrolase (beta-lactamase superfamily II)